MRNLYIDTVTATGAWVWKAADTDPSQPHMIRIAALLEEDGQEVEAICRLISPIPGWPAITEDGVRAHNIENGELRAKGVVLGAATAKIASIMGKADRIVAHNGAFHRKVLLRAWRDATLPPPEMPKIDCTMTRSADIVRVTLQSNGRWKWPRIGEAYSHFAGEGLSLPSDPIERGLAMVRAVRTIEHGIGRERHEDHRQN